MKNRFAMGFLVIMVLMFTLACATYQVGAAFEPREDSRVVGPAITFGNNNFESAFSFFPKMYPDSDALSAMGIGYDVNFKMYNFELINDFLFFFPAIGSEGRYFITTSEVLDGTHLPPDKKTRRLA